MTTSMIDIAEVKGREKDKSKLIEMLLSTAHRSNLYVLSMVGMGGIGKTTLAQFAFNDDKIKVYFSKKIWVCVSDPFDETRVAKAILESLSNSTLGMIELESLLQKIGELIHKEKFLLVLDDVWEEKSRKWEQLKKSLSFGLPGSKVLVTTRKETVASIMGCSKEDVLKVGNLSDDECWLIMSKIAFFDKSDAACKHLEEIGKKLSSKCKGLPLAAKALGGILRFRKTREEWQSILKSEIWEVEEAQNDVIAPLWLSYYDLSPAIKRCFSYCAIFPKDYQIKKKMLIELWMAQGYLNQKGSHDLEMIGENYFQNLVMRSFFQDFVSEHYNDQSICRCKMHDIVHDFAQIVGQSECLGVQVNGLLAKPSIVESQSSKVRHLGLYFSNCDESFFNSFHGTKKMRSLLMWGPPFKEMLLTTADLSTLFSELIHVRSLSFRNCGLTEIPSSISKLVHLRWLDLFGNDKLKKLPETLCELHNLQTIDVSFCPYLELPLGMENLINLKHLQNDGGPTKLPKGIAQLTGLRTLEEVDVGCDRDDAFSVGDLKNLNQLRGRLEIANLGAYNRHIGEAREAELKKKEHVTHLVLGFASRVDEEKGEGELLIEALEPSANLESLGIYRYRGTSFPSWTISLTNLRSISLWQCENLPSLGKLPCLETFRLVEMKGVKKVGVELLGIETQIGDRESKSEISASSSSSPSSSSSSSSVVVAFPKLTRLQFAYMDSWEEWDDFYNDKYDATTKPPPSIKIMPSLRSLEIADCPKLKALPDYILQNPMLHTLQILKSDLLEERYNEEKGEDWSKISHISNIRMENEIIDD